MNKIKFLCAALTLATIFNACTEKKTIEPKPLQPKKNFFLTDYASNPDIMRYMIPRDSANKMIESYLNSVGGTSTSSAGENIHSLILDGATLRAYLSDTTITKVKVMFAHTLSYINAGNEGMNAGYTRGALTVVIGGFNDDGNYVYGPEERVPNMSIPCPNYCPNSGSATSSLFQ